MVTVVIKMLAATAVVVSCGDYIGIGIGIGNSTGVDNDNGATNSNSQLITFPKPSMTLTNKRRNAHTANGNGAAPELSREGSSTADAIVASANKQSHGY